MKNYILGIVAIASALVILPLGIIAGNFMAITLTGVAALVGISSLMVTALVAKD